MKIAVWYNLPSGGGKRALYDHLVGLKARGHMIEIWRPRVPQKDYLDPSKLASEHEVAWDEYQRDSSFYPLKMYLAMKNVDRLAHAMEVHSRECAAQINAGGFDVLFANTDLWFHAPYIGRYVKIPRVLYIQEPNRPLYEAQPRLPWLFPEHQGELGPVKRLRQRGRSYIEVRNARVLATAECENARHYEAILVNSRFSRESVLRAYGIDARVCYLGIDASLFANHELPRERVAMCVGSLTRSKNPELIIRAIGTIRKEERPKLVWVCNFAETDEFARAMKGLAESLGVDFDLRQYVPDEELVRLLSAASVFVYAPRLEPFGLAPLEANACGTPVVAVAEGGVRETVEDGINGLLVDSRPEALGEGVRRLLAEPALARRLGETGKALVRSKWSVDAAADRLERNLLEVAGKVAV
jgi:glycosyltransferase involved in cell wall biosynthesis